MPRYRTGHRVPLNVYDGDVPVFQAHSIESAAELVELLNAGHHPQPCAADRALYEARCEIGRWHDALADLMTYFDAGHHPGDERMEEIRALMAAHRPVERPESPADETGRLRGGWAPTIDEQVRIVRSWGWQRVANYHDARPGRDGPDVKACSHLDTDWCSQRDKGRMIPVFRPPIGATGA